MRFQIALAVLIASIELFASKKINRFEGFKKPAPTVQAVNMNNNVNANSNSFALNAGICGDANAASFSAGTNYNMVGQQAGAGADCN